MTRLLHHPPATVDLADVLAAEGAPNSIRHYPEHTRNEQNLIIQQHARDNLAAYTRIMFPPFRRAPHHDRIIRVLHKVETGEMDRVILCIPPRHGKSTLATMHFPAWYSGRNPSDQIILAGGDQQLANKFGRRVRDLLRSEVHQSIFPGCVLTREARSVKNFTTTAGGIIIALGRGGAPLGHGGHLIVIDDPLRNQQEADSPVIRKALHEWFDNAIYTRLMSKSRILLIQTRMHEDDLAGYLLREHADDGWVEIRMPAIAEEDEFDESGKLVRETGEALWPSDYPLTRPKGEIGLSLERSRNALGRIAFQRQFQQRTGLVEGTKFREEWLTANMYTYDPDIRRMNRLILVDPANSKKKTSDFTGAIVLGLTPDRHVSILDLELDRLDLKQRWHMLDRLVDRWSPYLTVYEQYAALADTSYFSEKQDELHRRFPILPVRSPLKKEERIEKLIPWFAEGRIHFPTSLWRTSADGVDRDLVEVFLNDQYKVYPAGVHDDLLDALAWFLDDMVPLEWPARSREQQRGRGAPVRPEGCTWASD